MSVNIVDETKRHKLNRKMTGVIYEDRVWEQWYDPQVFSMSLPKMSQKDYLFQCIGNDKDRILLNNRGKMLYTVGEFEGIVKSYEKAFFSLKLNKGDRICIIGLNTPELYAIKYAATSLGLITCNLNILDLGINDDGKNRLFCQLERIAPRMIFTLNILEEKLYRVINDPKFAKVMKVSMPLDFSVKKTDPERVALSFKMAVDFISGKKITGKISLNEFLGYGKHIDFNDVEEVYEEGLPCNIAFTSGTTGVNKGVLLSHDANNALAFQQKVADFGFAVGSKHLALIPPFLAFWDADVVHVTLCLGAQNIIELKLGYEEIPKYFEKYEDVNLGIWPQYLWSSLIEASPKVTQNVREHLNIAIVGGERCEVSSAQNFHDAFNVWQFTGYGASEVDTTFSVTHPNCNKVGSCGLPLPFNNVKIVDDEWNDLTYNQPGRLLITSPCLMNEYYGRSDLTEKAFYTDIHGVKWYITGDYAVIDDDGSLTVLDRYKPPVEVKCNDQLVKVNLLDIAEIVKKNENVKICKLTYSDGKIVLHLVLNNQRTQISDDEAIESILKTIRQNLTENEWPDLISLVPELPRTPVGKVNYPELERIGKDLVGKNCICSKLTLSIQME